MRLLSYGISGDDGDKVGAGHGTLEDRATHHTGLWPDAAVRDLPARSRAWRLCAECLVQQGLEEVVGLTKSFNVGGSEFCVPL